MTIRKIFTFSILISFCLGIVFTSCNSKSNVKVALMLNNMRIARWQKDKSYFLEAVQKQGCEGTVVDADFNDQVQLTQAQELIKQGYKSLVIAAVNSTTGAAIVRLAKENGVSTISYDGVINNCPLDYIVSFEDKKIGKLMAEYAVSKAPSGGYIIIGGDKSNENAVKIRNGEEEVLSPFLKDGRIKILFDSYTEGWASNESYMTVKKVLKLSKEMRPTAILVSNDDMAQGVIKAFEEEDIPLPVITGQDAALAGCRSIVQGKQSMTVYKPIKKLASMAAELAIKSARGEKITGTNASIFNGDINVPVYFIDILSVDKNNLESTVIADGMQSKDEIMK